MNIQIFIGAVRLCLIRFQISCQRGRILGIQTGLIKIIRKFQIIRNIGSCPLQQTGVIIIRFPVIQCHIKPKRVFLIHQNRCFQLKIRPDLPVRLFQFADLTCLHNFRSVCRRYPVTHRLYRCVLRIHHHRQTSVRRKRCQAVTHILLFHLICISVHRIYLCIRYFHIQNRKTRFLHLSRSHNFFPVDERCCSSQRCRKQQQQYSRF